MGVLVVPGNMVDGEGEEDEVIGWSLTMAQSASNARQYRLGLEVLDPGTEEHPVPCDCKMGKCALMKALLEKDRTTPGLVSPRQSLSTPTRLTVFSFPPLVWAL